MTTASECFIDHVWKKHTHKHTHIHTQTYTHTHTHTQETPGTRKIEPSFITMDSANLWLCK